MDQKEEHPAGLAQDEASRRPPHLNYQESRLKDLRLWMTTQEAAEYSFYEVEHVRRLARQGRIQAVKRLQLMERRGGIHHARLDHHPRNGEVHKY